MNYYTVIALRSIYSNDVMVAGVVEGKHDVIDSGLYGDDEGAWQRYATTQYAADADEAASMTIEDLASEEERAA